MTTLLFYCPECSQEIRFEFPPIILDARYLRFPNLPSKDTDFETGCPTCKTVTRITLKADALALPHYGVTSTKNGVAQFISFKNS